MTPPEKCTGIYSHNCGADAGKECEQPHTPTIEEALRVELITLRSNIRVLEQLRIESVRLMSEIEARQHRPDRVEYFQAKHMEVCRRRIALLKACGVEGRGT